MGVIHFPDLIEKRELTFSHRILLATKDQYIRELLQQSLGNVYEVVSLDSSAQTLREFREGGGDLIILSLDMRESGLRQNIEKFLAYQGLPVMLLGSKKPLENTHEKVISESCAGGFFLMPFSIFDFCQQVNLLLGTSN